MRASFPESPRAAPPRGGVSPVRGSAMVRLGDRAPCLHHAPSGCDVSLGPCIRDGDRQQAVTPPCSVPLTGGASADISKRVFGCPWRWLPFQASCQKVVWRSRGALGPGVWVWPRLAPGQPAVLGDDRRLRLNPPEHSLFLTR